MTSGRYDVIVAGAGPAGQALALCLSKAFDGGLRVGLVAPRSSEEQTGNAVRASALGAASRRVLEAIGVWPQLASVSCHVSSIEITDSRLDDGVRPRLLTYEPRLDDGEPAMTIVPNADLQSALETAVAAASGITRIAALVTGLGDRSGPLAVVRLDDGQDITAPLVVAADGRRSALRQAAAIKTVDWSHSQTGIVAMVTTGEPHGGRAIQHFLPGGPFAILPLPGNRACITWSEETAVAEQLLAGPDAALSAALEQRAGGRLGTLRLEGRPRAWPLATFLARSLIAERLALLSDSARGVHPIAGQGLNLGLRDAAALTEVVTDATRTGQDLGSLAVLERYERWRRADGVMSAAGFDAINRLFSVDNTLVRSIRDVGLGLVDRMPAIKRRLVLEAAGLTGEVPRLMQGQPL